MTCAAAAASGPNAQVTDMFSALQCAGRNSPGVSSVNNLSFGHLTKVSWLQESDA